VLHLGCWLDDQGIKIQFPAGAGVFSLPHIIQIGFGALLNSVYWGCFLGCKALGMKLTTSI
jgi:hypothetical protein